MGNNYVPPVLLEHPCHLATCNDFLALRAHGRGHLGPTKDFQSAMPRKRASLRNLHDKKKKSDPKGDSTVSSNLRQRRLRVKQGKIAI
ncbi:hypothetical protein ACN38_g2505 [Penicillium nordicum]|uniref:Uncharacterized protein n=1 Tax=Penicillium nordicum TaxID=229535 RepID=A0A0M8P6T6_9EURO|nr:hypothetical protein ACN38_g2505 [Penicillium nordicum]